MGIYSNNRHSSIGNIQVEADLGYVGEAGVQLAMIEGYAQDLALFDSVISKDFQGVAARLEGATDEEVSVIEESAITDFFERIKQFFLSLAKKIKGIFQNFMAKFDSKVMKDSKAFHTKYSKVVYAKDLGKMKVKYSKPKGATFDFDLGSFSAAANKPCLSLTMLMGADVEKIAEDFDRDEYIVEVLNSCSPRTNISSVGEYDKEVHSACFEDEEEIDGADSIIRDVGSTLVDNKRIDTVRKANTSIEKAISDIIKEIEKSKKSIIDMVVATTGTKSASLDFGIDKSQAKPAGKGYNSSTVTAGNTAQNKKALKAVNYVQSQATAIQAASGKFTAAALREVKFEVAQARRVFAAAVAHNPKAVKESADLELAFQDEAEYEVMSAFDEIN